MKNVWSNVTGKGKRFNMLRLGAGKEGLQWTIPKIQMQTAEERVKPLRGVDALLNSDVRIVVISHYSRCP